MKKKFISMFSIFALIFLVNADSLNSENLPLQNENHIRYVINVGSTDFEQIRERNRWLHEHGFDVAGVNFNTGEIEVITNDRGIQLLNEFKIQGLPILTMAAPDSRYLNPATVETKLKALAQAYPQLTRLEQIGTSLQSRPIYALMISDTPEANNAKALQKPSMLVDGQHHAREVMTSEVVLDVADTLLAAAAAQDSRTLSLLHNWNIWVVPMLNVDGTNIVFNNDNMWRKNARAAGRSTYGVDINRNYDFFWSKCRGSSTQQSAQDFHGDSAASEPETKALQGLANAIRPTAYLSYHSFSELVLWSYGCKNRFPADKSLIERIGKELSDRLPTDDNRKKYKPGSPWEILYEADGNSMDYMTGKFGALSYTFEINTAFQPAYSLRDPTLKKHRSAWGYFLDRIDQNLLTINVVDGKTGNAVEAQIEVSSDVQDLDADALKTNSAGYYFKVLDPGSYVVSAKLPDGRTGSTFFSMRGQPEQITITVQ